MIKLNDPNAQVMYCIHPPSPLVNPFRITPNRNRTKVFQMYENYIKCALELHDEEVFPEMDKIRMQARLALARGKSFSIAIDRRWEHEGELIRQIIERNV